MTSTRAEQWLDYTDLTARFFPWLVLLVLVIHNVIARFAGEHIIQAGAWAAVAYLICSAWTYQVSPRLWDRFD